MYVDTPIGDLTIQPTRKIFRHLAVGAMEGEEECVTILGELHTRILLSLIADDGRPQWLSFFVTQWVPPV
jgi:hypothetical protein